jgi:DNA polymerase III subunit delta
LDSKPTVYILHGDDPFSIHRRIDEMTAQMGEPAMAEMNVSRLDGRDSSEETIRSAAYALPFFVDRRMVVLTHPFSRLTSEPSRARFREMLEGLPESTAFVLVLEDTFERGDWASFGRKHWFRRWWEDKVGNKVYFQLCRLPPLGEMGEWVRKEAARQSGRITPEASASLVGHVGNDTRIASLEIDKLLTYVDRQRPIEVEDVEELCAQTGQTNVFNMVDALAAGNTQLAQNLLHRLLEEEDEFSLFGMIVRQFRLLIQTRELLDEGKDLADVVKEVDRRDFIAKKLIDQARRFKMDRLIGLYHRLLEIDEAAKTSQMELGLSLDAFIADLSRA